VAGSFIDFQIGFALANVIDPLTGTMAPLFGNFKYYLAILLFLSFNAHHFLIKGIMDSYEWVPLSGNLFTQVASGSISEFLVDSFVSMFQIAFQMAAPFVVAIFVMEVVLGIMAKSMPQLNIFVVGIPLKILLGLVVFIILAPGMIYLLQDLFATMFEAMYSMMKLMQ
jgi:flagellar biosynthetic protein FliR